MEKKIAQIISSSISVKHEILNHVGLHKTIQAVVQEIITCYRKGGKLLLCGNGGSAADAQHIAAELSGRFYFDRPPLAAEALHVNSSYMTAVANDYSFDEVYARYVKSCGKPGDILIGLSTSGNSENVIRAFNAAKLHQMKTVALTGESGGKLKESSDYLINIPSSVTPRIQECHILIGHILCELVEEEMFT